MAGLGGNVLRVRELGGFGCALFPAIGKGVGEDNVLGEADLGAIFMGGSVHDLGSGAVCVTPAAGGLVLLARVYITHLDLFTVGGVGIFL